MELTPRQLDAVRADGSVAVVAGAGTGKTAMLAERYVHHVTVHGLSPLEIAAVTFTDKAAAELRSRIRAKLLEKAGEDAAAESDAAQISTMHSLAARICRDFYFLAGIPADFVLLDEIDAEIVKAAWFDEALAEIDPDVVRELGYEWLRKALRELFRDTSASAAALAKDESDWRRAIDERRAEALSEYLGSDCFVMAADIIETYRGPEGDAIERQRAIAGSAIRDLRSGQNVDAALDSIRSLTFRGGSPAKWPDGSFHLVKDCLTSLRDAIKDRSGKDGKAPYRDVFLKFGATDAEALRRAKLLARAFDTARDHLRLAKLERRLLDFDDLEQYAIEILGHREAREHYAERWRALLVDEFQDTNTEQEKLLLRLLDKGGVRLTIVGDGKQSIYGFRRADPRVFERFCERLGGGPVVLDRTFRTHAGLVAPLNSAFGPLLRRLHQPLDAHRVDAPHEGPHISAHRISGGSVGELREAEARFIAAEIRRMIDGGLEVWDKRLDGTRPVRPSDIAILSRTRDVLNVYIEKLLEAGVPAVNTGGGRLLETRVAMDLIALLRFVSDNTDDIALVSLLRGPFFGVSDRELYEISLERKTGSEEREAWWHLLRRRGEQLPAAVRAAVAILSQLVEAAAHHPAERVVLLADELTGYTAVIANLEQGERRMADWQGFIDLLRHFARLGRSDVVGAERYLKELVDAEATIPRPPLDAGDAVSLMTIHSAKGLEWPVVFVPDLCRGNPPDPSAVKIDAEVGAAFKLRVHGERGWDELKPAMLDVIAARRARREAEEAARVLYVAMTRPRDRLYLTAAGDEIKNDLKTLEPCLAAAGVPIVEVTRSEADAAFARTERPSANATEMHEGSIDVCTTRLAPRLASVSPSALWIYDLCPKRFEFEFIHGHPGVGEGTARARLVGTLTHAALESGERTADGLRRVAGESCAAADDVIAEALSLARRFDEHPAFAELRADPQAVREAALRYSFANGLSLIGRADLAGVDWVADFKTDAEVEPALHALQLWAYAAALGKRRAFVAYLRHDSLHEFSLADLEAAGRRAEQIADAIAAGSFPAKPSATVCGGCPYNVPCCPDPGDQARQRPRGLSRHVPEEVIPE
ncbi:MAG: UvrD-helicase domain-containing protein [Pyrinomonadaceae bacterium]